AGLAAAAFPTSAWVQRQQEEIQTHLSAEQAAAAPMIAAALEPDISFVEARFFAELERALEDRRWEEAADWIERARTMRPPPAWLERRDADLRLAQTRIGHGRDSTTEMLVAARLYLNGSNARSAQMLEVA